MLENTRTILVHDLNDPQRPTLPFWPTGCEQPLHHGDDRQRRCTRLLDNWVFRRGKIENIVLAGPEFLPIARMGDQAQIIQIGIITARLYFYHISDRGISYRHAIARVTSEHSAANRQGANTIFAQGRHAPGQVQRVKGKHNR